MAATIKIEVEVEFSGIAGGYDRLLCAAEGEELRLVSRLRDTYGLKVLDSRNALDTDVPLFQAASRTD